MTSEIKEKREKIKEHFEQFKKEFEQYLNKYFIEKGQEKIKWIYEERDRIERFYLVDGDCQINVGKSYRGGISFSLFKKRKKNIEIFKKLSDEIFSLLVSFTKEKKIDTIIFHETFDIKRKKRYQRNIESTGKRSKEILKRIKKLNINQYGRIQLTNDVYIDVAYRLKEKKIIMQNGSLRNYSYQFRDEIELSFSLDNQKEVDVFKQNYLEAITSSNYLMNQVINFLENLDQTSYYSKNENILRCRDQNLNFKIVPCLKKKTFGLVICLEKKRYYCKTVKEASVLLKEKLIQSFQTSDESKKAGDFLSKIINNTLTNYRATCEKSMCAGYSHYQFEAINEIEDHIVENLLKERPKNISHQLRKEVLPYLDDKITQLKYIAFQLKDYVFLYHPSLTLLHRPNKCEIMKLDEYKDWIKKEKKRQRMLRIFDKNKN